MIVQISIIDTTLMKYWITGQVRTIMSSVMCKSKFSMGEKIIMRFLMMPCEVSLRAQFRSARRIAMLGSSRVIVDVLGGAL